jgi:hypothetical protein
MPLQKILFKPGVNRENTRYTNEGGWYDCDKVRFRQGTPEKIGGWNQISANSYEGVCRSLWTWSTLGGVIQTGVGTNLKFYIEQGGAYYDITPIRAFQNALSSPFTATTGSSVITVSDTAHGAQDGDYVTFYGASALSTQTFTRSTATNFSLSSALATGTSVILSSTGSLPTGLIAGVQYYILVVSGTTVQFTDVPGGAAVSTSTAGTGTFSLYANQGITADVLNQTYAITYVDANSYTIDVGTNATAYDTGNGGTVNLFYQIPIGDATAQPLSGWGAGAWGVGGWGTGSTSTQVARLWYQANFGENLVLGYRGGPLYYWNASPSPQGLSTTITLNSQTVSAVDTGTEYITFSTAIANGTPVKLTSTVSLPSPLVANTVYYVVGASGATCQLALTSGGSAINLTTTGSGTISIFTAATFTIAGTAYDGQTMQFESSGTLPTGMTIGTIYYVQNYSSGSFELATTPTGQALVLTGTQTGTHTLLPNAVPVTSLAYASHVPASANFVTVSDASRFTIAFGTVPYDPASADTTTDSGTLDPMLIRWSDQESVTEWAPAITNQAGFIRLSHGAEIRAAIQTRQEIVVFTDSSVYSMQYIGAPYVWGSQILSDNISIAGYNTTSLASSVVYWMGVDKFYKYDGRVQTLRCDLRQYIYGDINLEQQSQFFSGTSEGFSEVWWFYCSANSTTIDKYVVYNYQEDAWYYGTMARTAWLDSGLIQYPQAATYSNNIVLHEYGVDDNTTGTPAAIECYITSSEFDIGDGNNFGFVWRLLPDVTFRGSTATNPQVTLYLQPLQNSGSGYNDPRSEGGVDYGSVVQTRAPTAVQVEEFTGQVNIRVRGRQMSFKVYNNQLGSQWQLGAPRMDIRPDGRR